MSSPRCPEVKHFHIVYESVDNFERPNKTIIAKTPSEALAKFITSLDLSWRGSISVFDDDIGHEDEMPVLHHILG